MSLLCNAYRKNLDYHNRLEVDDTMTPKVERKKLDITRIKLKQ